MVKSNVGFRRGLRKAIEDHVHYLVRQLIPVNGRDAPEAHIRSARRHSACELSEFPATDGVLRRSSHCSECPEQSRRFGPLTGVTKPDEHTSLPCRQVECGLKRIWRFGHEAAEQS